MPAAKYFLITFSIFRNFIKNKIVLDFGCGNGDFLYKSQNILKKGIGIDLGFVGKKHSDNKKINFLKKINQINDLDFKFDSIFLFHVFECERQNTKILCQKLPVARLL